MRLLMVPARVHLTSGARTPCAVAWDAPATPTHTAAKRVITVIDDWRYDGHWWEPTELRRHYYLLELDGGTQLELFQEGGAWWAARVSD